MKLDIVQMFQIWKERLTNWNMDKHIWRNNYNIPQ